MKPIALAFVLLFAVAFSVQAQDCEQAGSNMAAVRACLYEALEKDLDAAYRPLHRKVAGKDAQAGALLQKSQASWRAFVEDSCAFTTRVNVDGAIEEDARYNCQVDFTNARIKVLKAWMGQQK
ncbi:lysozyme inhibitor LprI family protein [Pseudomonas sp. CGJS7]|uniref:lysozyme inhibitor LprI family protein n=1 Tax=Pseudomonas sp. CGJS7 TaxID=3109348 RepID=UPI00300BAEB8